MASSFSRSERARRIPRPKTMLVIFVVIVGGTFAAFAAFLYFYQKNLIFHPWKGLDVSADLLQTEYENAYITVGNHEKIHGWYFPPPEGSPRRVVLFCHGNAGNIGNRLETAAFFVKEKVGSLMFDYRGYGNSDGEPSEHNVYADARAAYDWLIDVKGFKPDEIVLFGRSLGGAVAIDLASKVPSRGLIVESSFTSALDAGKSRFPFMPVKLLIKYHFDSISKIRKVHCPVLVTHSPDDEFLPYEMGEKLYEAANQPKHFVALAGGHNDREYLMREDYQAAFRNILYGSE
jgi:hypothetical protein